MLVLESTRDVVESARLVSIDDLAIGDWAASVMPDDLRPHGHELLAQLTGNQAQLANLILLIDALNFCFWSDNPIRFEWRGRDYQRFEAMLVSILLAARYNDRWFDAAYWVEMPRQDFEETLRGKGNLLLMDERERILRETGHVLLERFDGQFIHAIESVNEKAWPLAVLLMTNFDSFRDVARYNGKPVYFMKRAQICALDVSAAWDTHGYPPLSGLEELTAFADYRVPQALRRLRILCIDPKLEQVIDSEQEIPSGTDAEIELRAATIHAVDRMVLAAAKVGKRVPAWQVDWYLWGFARLPSMAPRHHRTRTVYY